MEITQKVLDEMKEQLPERLPETGGIIGGTSNRITECWIEHASLLREGVPCSYAPNVEKINAKIQEWQENGIQFLGMFHTHYFGVDSLSEGDVKYIRNIMNQMPEEIKCLYFPLFVFPEKKLILYLAKKGTCDIRKIDYVLI